MMISNRRTPALQLAGVRVLLSALGVAQGIVLSAGIAGAQSRLEVLHAFTPPAGPVKPNSPLIQAADGNFYGTTSGDGSSGQGTVFRLAPGGTITVLHEFAGGTDGASPSGGLIQATDGNLYGSTSGGGTANLGTVFRMSPDGTTTILHNFVGGTTDGDRPASGLIQASDGNFYGTDLGESFCASAGVACPTIFKMTLDGTVTILHRFGSSDGSASTLLQASDGNFYGATSSLFFEITAGGVFTVVATFPLGFYGRIGPSSRIIEARDGSFYGGRALGGSESCFTTLFNRPVPCGDVFRITRDGTSSILHAFAQNGFSPTSLIQASDGNFYGTTYYGGSGCVAEGEGGCGTVYRMTPDGAVTVLHSFAGGSDGAHPGAALVQATDGNFYGTTPSDSGLGTAFRMTPSGDFSVLPAFTGGPDGAVPRAALIRAADGNFYGTTYSGGSANLGTVFRMTASGAVTVLHSFTGGTDGARPVATLTRAADGNFYGTTTAGGGGTSTCNFSGCGGTVFRMTPDGTVTVLHAFTGGTDGDTPYAALIQAADGSFYGTTIYGGNPTACPAFVQFAIPSGCGTIFRIAPGELVTVVHAFTGSSGDGSNPRTGLIQSTDGNFYGTTNNAFFEMAPSGIVTVLTKLADGLSTLIHATDGNFYGTTQQGGTGFGSVVRMTPAGAVSILHAFDRSEGGSSNAALIQGIDGNFYGTTYYRGTGSGPGCDPRELGCGTVFQMTPSGMVTVLHAFTGGADGKNPRAALIQTPDRNVYGTAEGGGDFANGVVFRVTGLPARKAERAVYRPASRTWHMLQPDGSVVESAWGLDGDVPVPGDYDGDRRTDMAVYRPSTGVWYILQSSGGFADFVSLALGRAGDVPVPADYDGDGITDLAVYRPSAGTWTLRLSGSPSTPVTIALGRATDVPVPGDYDGDGRADPTVYRPSTGRWIIRLSAYGYTTSTTMTLGVAGDVPVPADYDGDGRTDVAVYRPSSGMWYLQMSGGGVTPIARQWGLAGDIPAPADFDGDGKIDPAVYRPSTGEWWVLQSSSGYTTSTTTAWGLSGDTPLPNALVANAMAAAAAAAPRSPLVTAIHTTDFGGDNRADITVYRPGSGQWFVLNSETGYSTERVQQWGLPGDLPAAGDFDGDGTADAAIYRPSSGTWWVLKSSSAFTQAFSVQWGLTGDMAVPADYDGDGRTDIAVYRPSTGEWYIRWSNSDYATASMYQWGLPGDVPLLGDYDGDGLADFAVYRPSNGVWYVLTSSSAYTAMAAYQWGLPGDVAVPGDYDGDGRTDFAIYRPSSGEWYVRQSSTNFTTYAIRQWGLSGDTPVPADYDGDGITDLAVFRPGEAIWYVMNSATGTWEFHQWGLNGDVPINERQ